MIQVRYEHHNETRVTLSHEALAEWLSYTSFIKKFVSNVYHSKFNLRRDTRDDPKRFDLI